MSNSNVQGALQKVSSLGLWLQSEKLHGWSFSNTACPTSGGLLLALIVPCNCCCLGTIDVNICSPSTVRHQLGWPCSLLRKKEEVQKSLFWTQSRMWPMSCFKHGPDINSVGTSAQSNWASSQAMWIVLGCSSKNVWSFLRLWLVWHCEFSCAPVVQLSVCCVSSYQMSFSVLSCDPTALHPLFWSQRSSQNTDKQAVRVLVFWWCATTIRDSGDPVK